MIEKLYKCHDCRGDFPNSELIGHGAFLWVPEVAAIQYRNFSVCKKCDLAAIMVYHARGN